MSSASLSEFWIAFRSSIRPSDNMLQHFTHVHGQERYIEFSTDVGLGFRPRAVALFNNDQLRAELLGSTRQAKAFVNELLEDGNGTINLNGGGSALLKVTENQSHARIHLEWNGASVTNERFWTVHHLWIRLALFELVESMHGKFADFAKQQG